jgi:hypothetical protein
VFFRVFRGQTPLTLFCIFALALFAFAFTPKAKNTLLIFSPFSGVFPCIPWANALRLLLAQHHHHAS